MLDRKRADRLVLRIANRTPEMNKVADGVSKFGADHGLPSGILNALNVALDEILSNTIRYGYVDDYPHEITVTLFLKAGELVAEVQDDGIAFDPLAAPAPDLSGGLHDRKLGGLGVHLVRSLMDGVEYTRKGTSNRLRLVKRLGTHGSTHGDPRRASD
jgi:serine/threonine-protein kinase RsbW